MLFVAAILTFLPPAERFIPSLYYLDKMALKH